MSAKEYMQVKKVKLESWMLDIIEFLTNGALLINRAHAKKLRT